MKNSDLPPEGGVPHVVRRLQIIVGSLVLGCLSFLAVALALSFQGGAPPAGRNTAIVTQCAVGFALIALVARFIVPAVIVSRGRRKILQETSPRQRPRGRRRAPNLAERIQVTSRLWALWTASTIVAAAIFDGAAFFALVAYIVERSTLSLIVAIGLVVFLAREIPTQSRLIFWTLYQLEMLDQEQ